MRPFGPNRLIGGMNAPSAKRWKENVMKSGKTELEFYQIAAVEAFEYSGGLRSMRIKDFGLDFQLKDKEI